MRLSEIVQPKIVEADDAPAALGPVEVRDIVDGRSPEMAKKYLRALWGKDRLTFQGKPFFGKGDTVYDDVHSALDAAKKLTNTDGIELTIEAPDAGDLEGFDFTWAARVDDQQEVYLGYEPKGDVLWVGVDAWTNEESFNQAWDEEFEKHTGEEFDMENEDHDKMFKAVHKEFLEMGFLGILYQLTGDPINSADQDVVMPGGFYKGIYRGATFKSMNLIDLRLD